MENMIENIDDHVPRARIRQMALFTKTVHWRILMEREHGELPVFEVPLSIRRKCLELEAGIIPEVEDLTNAIGNPDNWTSPHFHLYSSSYTSTKWSLLLLKKPDDIRVKRLIALMKEAEMPKDKFCDAIGLFSENQPFGNINLGARPLSEFTPEEVEICLKKRFRSEPQHESKTAIKAITHVLMKL